MFLSAHWALLLKLPSDRSNQVSSTKIRKWSDFFRLFSVFSLRCLPAAPFAFTKYLPEKFGNRLIFSDFFRFFFPEACILPGSSQTSIFQKKSKVAGKFWTFFNFFYDPAEIPVVSEQVSFQKLWKLRRCFWFFPFFPIIPSQQRNLLPISPNKYLSKKAPNGSDFFDFFWKIFSTASISIQVSFQKQGIEGRFFWIFFIFLSSSIGMWRKQVGKRRKISFNYWK